jgi:alpha 1,3-glucosidase
MEKIPLLMRGGHVFARRDVPRRSSALMHWDDYTLVVSVSKDGKVAEGDLYVDDGDSFDFERGQYIHRRFVFDGAAKSLVSVDAEGRDPAAVEEGEWMRKMRAVGVDKIVLIGVPASWAGKKSVKVLSEGREWEAKVEVTPAAEGRAAFAVVRKVGVRIGADWSVQF